jgi:HSP20 family protein
LRGLAEQFGFPINEQVAEGADFTPPVDVFDTTANYIVHVSLPGAKKSDLSIDYDADESALRLAGVIYRPGMTEDLHEALVMEERAREVGVFEREVRLGSREAPADISVDEISAKLEEGVLVVTLPKIVRQPEPKKKVVVEDGNSLNEKSPAYTSEQASVTMTPTESEDESDEDEGETKEYVKIPVE